MKTTTILIGVAVITGIYFLTQKDDKVTSVANGGNGGNAGNENEIQNGHGNAIFDENGAVLIPDSGMRFNIGDLVAYQSKKYRIINIDKLKNQYKLILGIRTIWVEESSVTAA